MPTPSRAPDEGHPLSGAERPCSEAGQAEDLYTDEIEDLLVQVTDERLFVVAEALRRGFSPQKINHITKMDLWFLDGFKRIIDMETSWNAARACPLPTS